MGLGVKGCGADPGLRKSKLTSAFSSDSTAVGNSDKPPTSDDNDGIESLSPPPSRTSSMSAHNASSCEVPCANRLSVSGSFLASAARLNRSRATVSTSPVKSISSTTARFSQNEASACVDALSANRMPSEASTLAPAEAVVGGCAATSGAAPVTKGVVGARAALSAGWPPSGASTLALSAIDECRCRKDKCSCRRRSCLAALR